MRFVVAAAAVAFLVVGFALRPDVPPPAQPEAPGPLLQQVVEQREAVSVVRALQDVGNDTVRYGVFVVGEPVTPDVWSDWEPGYADAPARARYGVVVGAAEVLAYVEGLSAEAPVRVMAGDGRQMTGQIVEPLPGTGLARIALDTAVPLVPPQGAETMPRPGDPVVAASAAPGGRLIAPLFVASTDGEGLTATTTLEPLLGAPVFSVARELVGVVALGDRTPRIVALDAVMQPATPAAGPAPLGLTLERRMTDEADLPVELVIRALDPEARAARAGAREGDIVVAVNGEAVGDLPQARSMLAAVSDSGFELDVRRGRRVTTLQVPSAEPQR
jgi:S1-C subfamily serine protease